MTTTVNRCTDPAWHLAEEVQVVVLSDERSILCGTERQGGRDFSPREVGTFVVWVS